MRKILVAAMTAGLLAVAAPAFAGPGGTSENSSNQVNCNSGTATGQQQRVPGSGIWVKADGSQSSPQSGGALVVCNDAPTNNGVPVPIQGRVIASGGTSGGYVAADGDADNPTEAEGWARIDLGTSPAVRCGGAEGGGTNAETPTATATNCDPR